MHIAEFDKLAPIVAEVPEKAKILAEKYWPGPLTMILPKSDLVPQETTGGLDSVAVRFPSDRIAQELIKLPAAMWQHPVPTLQADPVRPLHSM